MGGVTRLQSKDRVLQLEREFDALRAEYEDERRRREAVVAIEGARREGRRRRLGEVTGVLAGLGGACVVVETILQVFH